MDSSRTGSGASVELLAHASFEHPKLVLLVWAFLLGGSLVGLARLPIETNTESVLDRRSEEWHFYQESQRTFGGDEGITVAIRGRDSFDLNSLALVDRLTEELETLNGVRRVDSLSTVPLVEAERMGRFGARQ
jgi:predicted RND superfamily exporter protein